MHSYIIIHHTSQNFQVALFDNDQRVDMIVDDKRLASKLLISIIDTILLRNARNIADLTFIGINQGPGLFSTLRSIIATVNGLHFATSIPLIGIDALDATYEEYKSHTDEHVIVLLDAFNHDVYYAMPDEGKNLKKGYENIHIFLANLHNRYNNQPITFIGNGAQLYHDLIAQQCGTNTVIQSDISPLCSIDTIARKAHALFFNQKLNQKDSNHYLLPLHLKKHPVLLRSSYAKASSFA